MPLTLPLAVAIALTFSPRSQPGRVALLRDEEDKLRAELHALESGPDGADLM